DRDDAKGPHRDVGSLARRLLALLDQPEDIRRVGPKGLARGGEPDAAPDALGQLDAELAREGRNRSRDRGLGDVELLRRCRDRSLARDGQKALELIQSDCHKCDFIVATGYMTSTTFRLAVMPERG